MKRALFHLLVALVPFYVIGEAYNYKWGSAAYIMFVLYSLCTWESGYKQGHRDAWPGMKNDQNRQDQQRPRLS